MRFDVLTLFPEMFQGPLQSSIQGRAMRERQVEVVLHDIRDHADNKHRNVDDTPYGGGAGMVMSPVPVVAAIEAVRASHPVGVTLLMAPSGRPFDQAWARQLAQLEPPSITLVCGRYEGVDARVGDHYCDDELSIGDYVLTGGELAALVVIDAVTRLIPGVLGNAESPVEESLEDGLLEYPQYTRPRDFRGHVVPDVLLGGNHAEIARWRAQASLTRTHRRRPDLLAARTISGDVPKTLDS